MAGSFWVGQDGNVWVADGGGTRSIGAASDPRVKAQLDPTAGIYGRNLTQIADPLPGGVKAQAPPTATAPGGGSGASSVSQASVPVGPSQAQLDPLLETLKHFDTILANRNAQSQAEFDRANAGYDAQDKLDAQAHDASVHQNESTLTSNNQRALLNAANAATGLKGVLASIGGLAGSGHDVINHLVGLAANTDSGAAHQAFETNADTLNQAWSRADQQQHQRREDAKATLANNEENNQAGVLTSKQSVYQQLANMYGANDSHGRDYASQAAQLAAPIAATTHATVAPYQAASSSFSPDALKSYLAGTQNLQVNTSGGDGGTVPANSPLYLPGQKKESLAGVA